MTTATTRRGNTAGGTIRTTLRAGSRAARETLHDVEGSLDRGARQARKIERAAFDRAEKFGGTVVRRVRERPLTALSLAGVSLALFYFMTKPRRTDQ
ncbi:hypothetical protein DWG18_01225 [Lysobacter sp. TY2-98]|uniref:hypothetical protein n=1 Tax=Lysobacter sp. TY2-98 TaxID=2290922 RepID=UPI000E202AC4|nr:hypothetical protein [Lysobacter sp. TY2-98]AXK71041.1 hypothetical protein DWG18_01225 [Lysobacter sp. TY2-98]